jgi:hypothetical protein
LRLPSFRFSSFFERAAKLEPSSSANRLEAPPRERKAVALLQDPLLDDDGRGIYGFQPVD